MRCEGEAESYLCANLGFHPECVFKFHKSYARLLGGAEYYRKKVQKQEDLLEGFSIVWQETWWLGPAWWYWGWGRGDGKGLDSECVLTLVLLEVPHALAWEGRGKMFRVESGDPFIKGNRYWDSLGDCRALTFLLALAPDFRLNPVKRLIPAARGGEIVIPCQPRAAPKAVVLWSKGTEILVNSSRYEPGSTWGNPAPPRPP